MILSDTGNVDIVYEDQELVQGLQWGEITEVIPMNTGSGILSVYPEGEREQALVQNRVLIPEDGNYTIIIADRDGVAILATVKESEVDPAEEVAGIRMGHLLYNTEPVTIVINDRYEKQVIELRLRDQYKNMKELLNEVPHVCELANRAVEKAGYAVVNEPARGGTDGSTLTFMGLPCPNLGTGSSNHHGRHEVACVQDMEKMVQVLLNLVEEVVNL
jgi:acetylornithine deacetylase/succinyl-diaminopimelate desuccinylase-like protein